MGATLSTPPVLWLGDPAAMDPARVGGKAARLSVLAGRWPVPPGFCLPAGLFAGGARLAAGLRRQVAAAYEEMSRRRGGEGLRVAVRSSGLEEDGRDASFAGQHASVLNVAGPAGLLAAIETVLASADGESARAYRRSRLGRAGPPAPLGVLVQEMVLADVSGVAFTADPVTGSRSEIVIEACWGLGAALVEGRVQPDRHRLRKADLSLAEERRADKQWMAVAGADGIREVRVPTLLRRRRALAPEQAQEIARLAREIERELGWPADVEFALQDRTVYVLQCRPVTGLSP